MLTQSPTSDPAFLAALLDARLHALTVLRSILDLATLPPEARAAILSDKTGQLTLLRESRLAAAQILQLPISPTGCQSASVATQTRTIDSSSSRFVREIPRVPLSPRPQPLPRLSALPSITANIPYFRSTPAGKLFARAGAAP